jgi:anthranilate phosphoribosyltransferase
VKSFADGVAAAKKSIDSGQAKSVLDRLRRASPRVVKTST